MAVISRHIDGLLGTLEGEGAQQEAAKPAIPDQAPPAVVTERPLDPTYYGKPILKEPVWIWTVPLYFYVGGVSGASMLLGEVTRLMGGLELRPLVRRCHWVGFIGGGIGSVLLIADLGRPERFLAMLRMLRLRSPMSVGSWVLTGAAPLAGFAALFHDPVTSFGSGLLGIPLAGYTGVLLANTAVPIWQAGRTSLPVLFIGSAIAAAGQVLKLLGMDARGRRVANTFGILGGALELVAERAYEGQAERIPAVGRPLRTGVSGVLWNSAKALTMAGLMMSIFGRGKRAHQVGALLGTAGSLVLRYAVMQAGRASARDPRATFHQQRANS
jgi:formate-dependent nitrite reductase membrane component NrfD